MQLGLMPRNVPRTSFEKVSSPDKEKQALLNSIYAPDDKSGAPQDSLAIFMSDKTSPEIVDFMKRTILRDYGSNVRAEFKQQDLDNMSNEQVDAVFSSIPNVNETLKMYEDRILKQVDDEKQKIQVEKKMRALRRQIKNDFNSD